MKCFLFPRRYQQRSAVKLAGCFATTSAMEITAFSAISDFFSCILVLLVIGLAAGRLSIQSLLMSSKVKWTYALSSFTPSIFLDHFHSPHSNEPVPHEVLTCRRKASTAEFSCKSFFPKCQHHCPLLQFTMHLLSNKSTKVICIRMFKILVRRHFTLLGNFSRFSSVSGCEEWSFYHQKPQRYYLNKATCISTVESACF